MAILPIVESSFLLTKKTWEQNGPSDEDWLKRGPNFVAVPDIEKGYNQSGYSSAVGWDNGCSMKVNGECLVSARYRYDFASTFYSVRCIKN